MRRTECFALLITFLLCCWIPSAEAQAVTIAAGGPPPGGDFFIASGPGGMGLPPPPIIPPLMMGMQAAHLTASQRKQVGEILRANREQTMPLIEKLHSIHEQIADKLLGSGSVSASDLAPLEEQAAKLDSQIQQQSLDASVKIRALLTPAQVAKMAQFHDKMSALQAQMRDLMKEAAPPPPPAR